MNYLNSANNSIQIRFSSLVAKKEGINEKFSIQEEEQLIDFHKQLIKQVKRLNKFFVKFDKSKVEKIISKHQDYKDLEQKYKLDKESRSNADSSEGSAEINQLHIQLLDMLKQVNIFIELIASSLVELESEQS